MIGPYLQSHQLSMTGFEDEPVLVTFNQCATASNLKSWSENVSVHEMEQESFSKRSGELKMGTQLVTCFRASREYQNFVASRE